MNNPLLTEDIGVCFYDMNSNIHEQIFFNSDGSYTILINSRLNWEQQMLAYQHALFHIINNDFEKSDVDEIEKQAHLK